MSKKLTRKAFEKWLSEQPAREMFLTREPWKCPIGAYLGFTDARSGGVKSTEYRTGPSGYKPLPGWAQDFVAAIDKRRERITAARALRILRAIP